MGPTAVTTRIKLTELETGLLSEPLGPASGSLSRFEQLFFGRTT